MGEHELLIRHAEAWAQSKKRPFDRAVAEEALDLRARHDETPATSWPSGSAERLLLVTWPAYGPAVLPALDVLGNSLETYWRFLRATGRSASGSAAPNDLAKEARRALPKMAAACAEPANHSQARVLTDFGRTIGVELDEAADLEEMQGRLNTIMAAWNELPTEERRRLMPDASPKGVVGQRFTAMANEALDASETDEPFPFRGDVARAGAEAKSAAYVQACVRLADWVGAGREVTGIGVLRPAVAREAYQALDLWPWQREWDRLLYRRLLGGDDAGCRTDDPEVDRLRAHAALTSWTSAADCLALDRLWYACDASSLVDLGSRKAARSDRRPVTAEEWMLLGCNLVLGLCLRLGHYRLEPMLGALLTSLQVEDGRVPMAEVRAWWDSRYAALHGNAATDDDTLREIWAERLDWSLAMFEDTGLWVRDEQRFRLTDFGREFTLVLINAIDSGVIDPES